MQASRKLNKADITTIVIAIITIIALAITTILISLKDGADKAKKEKQTAEELAVNKRNTRRRQDMARILSAFNDYQANNNGNFPEEQAINDKFLKMYIISGNEERFTDPDGEIYHFSNIHDWTNGKPQNYIPAEGSHEISVNYSAKCAGNDDTPLTKAGGKREIAILYALEGGAIYCGDNQ